MHVHEHEHEHEHEYGDGHEHEAPAVLAEAPRKREWLLPISIVIAAVLVGGSLVFSALYKPSPAAPAAPSGQAVVPTGPTSAAVAAAMQLTADDVALGDANAPVTVIEYGDYQCPFCTRFFTQVEPQIVQNYVKTGKAKFVFRNFPFIDRFPGLPAGANESHAAAAAAECAKDQGKFWEFHDALYNAKVADEAKGGTENDGAFSKTLFGNIAQQLSINISTFTSCVVSGKYASRVNDQYTAAASAGVNSTPSVYVNGKPVVDANGQSVGADGPSILRAIDAALGA